MGIALPTTVQPELDNNDNGPVVYPNPSAGQFTIANLPSSNWQVHSLDGRAVFSGNASQVDLSDVADGIYLLRFQNGVCTRLVKGSD